MAQAPPRTAVVPLLCRRGASFLVRAMPWRAHLPVGTSASPVHAVHLPEETAADCAAASSAVRIVAPDLPVLGVALFPLKVSRAEQECMACSPNTGPPGMLVLWEVKERRGGPIDEEIPVQPGAGSLRPGQVKRAVVEKEKLRTGRSVSRWQGHLWEGASCKTTVEV